MMRVSTRARYALRMMLDVARHGGENSPVSLSAVSERTDISRGYLEQVVLSLRSARLLRGVSGRRGGYLLAFPPAEITVGQVFEALIGPLSLVDCVDDPATCRRSDCCECRMVYQLISDRIIEVLRSHTLANLLDPGWLRAHGGGGSLGGDGDEWIDGFGCNPTPGNEEPGDPC